ncbi:hypothetical protein [Rhizobium tubonense]|uniref:Uncharacterized protein n=1 Tax=Rhizobium tubonense TaxID=484088 RepID=A0A2W4CBI5_9HYPH|nr:hypothetical protein [Rhizobium tubonense]PZM10181.1 hypothetical protein CPY51_23770 [Rhizobium tubonense]
MVRIQGKYNRRDAEQRFSCVYEAVSGDRCIYCGMPNNGKFDHQPPVYALHRFSAGALVTKRQIREQFGTCQLVPCCTICNMGLGAYIGCDINDRRREIADWFLPDNRYPGDKLILVMGYGPIKLHFKYRQTQSIYSFPAVGRAIYISALTGLMKDRYKSFDDFPDWLIEAQRELNQWLHAAPKRSGQHFLEMARLESYRLVPSARSDPRGQFSNMDAN